MPRRERKRTTKKRTTGRGQRAQEPRLTSNVITTITLKSSHKKEEVYPLLLSDLVSRTNVGSDADILAKSYTIRLDFASGNKLNTVSANLGHDGPWVRRGSSTDTFNQQFRGDKSLSMKGTVHFKKKLQESEREYINPDVAQNIINLRIRDPCGVIPGVTVKVVCIFQFVRRQVATTFLGANEPATDRYADQNVNSGAIIPPTGKQDIPFFIIDSQGHKLPTPSRASPFNYPSVGGTGEFYDITVSGAINKIGEFKPGNRSDLQKDYTADGFEGQIVRG